MGKATELISKIREGFNEITFHKFTDAELDAEIKSILGSLTEEEIESEVLEDIDGVVSEAVSTFPKAKMVKSMQALIKKMTNQIKSQREDAMYKSNRIAKYTRGKGPNANNKPENPAEKKTRLKNLKDAKAQHKDATAKLDKLYNVRNRAQAQLDKLNAERKEYNKKRKQDAKKK
jgi:hypothetical protein